MPYVVAVLAGNRAEFTTWKRANPNPTKQFRHLIYVEDAQCLRLQQIDEVVTVGTWDKRPGATELRVLAESRKRSQS